MMRRRLRKLPTRIHFIIHHYKISLQWDQLELELQHLRQVSESV